MNGVVGRGRTYRRECLCGAVAVVARCMAASGVVGMRRWWGEEEKAGALRAGDKTGMKADLAVE